MSFVEQIAASILNIAEGFETHQTGAVLFILLVMVSTKFVFALKAGVRRAMWEALEIAPSSSDMNERFHQKFIDK
ncbi:hypothetical protein [Herbaspirillum huttiense]|uniref:hypothetical protein n=1 Tax=Herbaspirillum huttiense TaxID=863372 RepID=UPI0031D767F8